MSEAAALPAVTEDERDPGFMDFDRALKIVSAINDRCFYAMGLVDKVGSLQGVSLAEMIRAKAIVAAANAKEKPGPHTIHVVPDDRLIAAAYALEYFAPSKEAVAMVPTRQWPYDRRALGVVGLEPETKQEGEEE